MGMRPREGLKWRCWLVMRMNRRGGIGDFVSMIISIIAIAFILAGFILMAGTFTRFVEKPAAVAAYGDSGLEGDFFKYMEDEYVPFLEEKFEIRKGVVGR